MPTRAAALAIIEGVVGQTPWGLKLGHGSFVTIEFGKQQSAESSLTPHGEWHLWLYMCSWRFELEENILAASDDDRPSIEGAFKNIDLDPVIAVELGEPSVDLRVEFSGGVVLRTFSMSSAPNMTQWILFTPNKKCLTAYGDGSYEITPSDAPWPRA
jgi:hypothetical protein